MMQAGSREDGTVALFWPSDCFVLRLQQGKSNLTSNCIV